MARFVIRTYRNFSAGGFVFTNGVMTIRDDEMVALNGGQTLSRLDVWRKLWPTLPERSLITEVEEKDSHGQVLGNTGQIPAQRGLGVMSQLQPGADGQVIDPTQVDPGRGPDGGGKHSTEADQAKNPNAGTADAPNLSGGGGSGGSPSLIPGLKVPST